MYHLSLVRREFPFPESRTPGAQLTQRHRSKGTTRELWEHFGEDASIQLEDNHGKWIYNKYFLTFCYPGTQDKFKLKYFENILKL